MAKSLKQQIQYDKQRKDHGPAKSPEAHESLDYEETDEKLVGTIRTLTRIQTKEEVIERLGVNPDDWRVSKLTGKAYEVLCKTKVPQEVKHPTTGEVTIEMVEIEKISPLWSVGVELRPIGAVWLRKSNDQFLEKLTKVGYKPPKLKHNQKKKDGCVLEISIADAHAGKMAVDRDFTLDKFRHLFLSMVQDAIERAGDHNIRKILLPIGNDLMNIDSEKNTTNSGRHVMPNSQSFAEVYEAVKWAALDAVQLCRKVAPVEVIHVPGNHDWTSSYHVASVLDAMHAKDKHVNVDIDTVNQSGRKYFHQGNILIGFSHGHQEKLNDMPMLMAIEQSEAWRQAVCREFHIGHRHFRRVQSKKIRGIMTEENTFEQHSVVVRQLPSISPDDAWHSDNGYVGSAQASEAFLYSLEEGLLDIYFMPVDRYL